MKSLSHWAASLSNSGRLFFSQLVSPLAWETPTDVLAKSQSAGQGKFDGGFLGMTVKSIRRRAPNPVTALVV